MFLTAFAIQDCSYELLLTSQQDLHT